MFPLGSSGQRKIHRGEGNMKGAVQKGACTRNLGRFAWVLQVWVCGGFVIWGLAARADDLNDFAA